MASATSSVSGNTTTYVITDQANNTCTVTAGTPGTTVAFSGSLLNDGQQLLATLLGMLVANGNSPRPQIFVNAGASFFS